jgi:hypothetical protein
MVPGVAVAVGVDLVVPHGDALAHGVDILHGGGGGTTCCATTSVDVVSGQGLPSSSG